MGAELERLRDLWHCRVAQHGVKIVSWISAKVTVGSAGHQPSSPEAGGRRAPRCTRNGSRRTGWRQRQSWCELTAAWQYTSLAIVQNLADGTDRQGVAQHIRIYVAGVDSHNLDLVGTETGQRSSSKRAIIGLHRSRVAIGTLNDDPPGRVAEAGEQAQPCDQSESGNRLGRAGSYAVRAEANQPNP